MVKDLTMPGMEISRTEKRKISAARTKETGWFSVLVVSVTSAIFSAFSGLILSGLAYFKLVENADRFNQIGIWLIVAVFPLIMLTAHALDKIGEAEKLTKRKNKL